MSEEKEKPCPVLSARLTGFVPEYRNTDGVWKRIPCVSVDGAGVRRGSPLDTPALLLVDAFSYEAAMSIAWGFLANDGHPAVRIVPYKIEYDLRAWRKEDKAEELDPLSMLKNSAREKFSNE